jgi:hypothetical protein
MRFAVRLNMSRPQAARRWVQGALFSLPGNQHDEATNDEDGILFVV